MEGNEKHDIINISVLCSFCFGTGLEAASGSY